MALPRSLTEQRSEKYFVPDYMLIVTASVSVYDAVWKDKNGNME